MIRNNRNVFFRWTCKLGCLVLGLGIAQAVDGVTNEESVTKLKDVEVVGKLDTARDQIVPSLGGTEYKISEDQIAVQAQGANAPFNQVLLRAPGMAQDSFGQLHLRGEHANLQYRINDVLLPEGISGFGSELDTRFMDHLQLITGSLPAQYGFRTAGIVDIQSKSGAFENGGEVGVYVGSFDTIRPYFEYGGSESNVNYFVNASYDHNALGIENPTSSRNAIHDDTDQSKVFAYMSDILNESSRITTMFSASYATYQLPDTPGLPAGTAPNGNPWLPGSFNSAGLNENQNEQNYYGVVAYQIAHDDVNLQISPFVRNSSVHFTPDPVGDLYFNGVASDVLRSIDSGGLQADMSYKVNDAHTLRGGVMLMESYATINITTRVFPVDANGNPTGGAYPIVDNSTIDGQFYGVYVQDEWTIVPHLTLNYGARFDATTGYLGENQVSPRVNAIWEATDTTKLHLGYSRYFTPPPLELVSSGDLSKFNNTSNASAVQQDDPVKAERANYYDAGLTQKITKQFQVGLDGYYKTAHNQLDDGYFGQTLILSPFNYAEGRIYGTELTANYDDGGFSAYANLAYSVAKGEDVTSAQFLFDQADLNYIQSHWVYLDHDQRWTASAGVSYKWDETRGSTRVFADMIYGSGLRADETLADGSGIPNGSELPSYATFNIGAEQDIKISTKQQVKFRLDVVNVADRVYEIRNGTGIGVNAAQYGEPRGIFGSIAYAF